MVWQQPFDSFLEGSESVFLDIIWGGADSIWVLPFPRPPVFPAPLPAGFMNDPPNPHNYHAHTPPYGPAQEMPKTPRQSAELTLDLPATTI